MGSYSLRKEFSPGGEILSPLTWGLTLKGKNFLVEENFFPFKLGSYS